MGRSESSGAGPKCTQGEYTIVGVTELLSDKASREAEDGNGQNQLKSVSIFSSVMNC